MLGLHRGTSAVYMYSTSAQEEVKNVLEVINVVLVVSHMHGLGIHADGSRVLSWGEEIHDHLMLVVFSDCCIVQQKTCVSRNAGSRVAHSPLPTSPDPPNVIAANTIQRDGNRGVGVKRFQNEI